ncbi:MAG: hypothetical protein WAV67_13650 [Dokdonella sp.]
MSFPLGHIPMALQWREGQPVVDCCYVGDERFHDPFFIESTSRHMQLPYNLAFRPQLSLSALGELVRTERCASPSGFIFHMSRCGSTLLHRMLCSLPATLSISESPAIDQALMLPTIAPDLPESDYLDWIRGVVLATGRPRGYAMDRYFVKFDAWHCSHIGWIERAFPEVPWMMLIRDPLEVLVSAQKNRAANSIAGIGPLPAATDLASALQMADEEYLARVLAQHLHGALLHANSPNGLIVNYRDLPTNALPKILAHFKLAPSAAELESMLAATTMHAKHPAMAFEPDAARKQSDASKAARQWSAALMSTPYHALDQRAWRP